MPALAQAGHEVLRLVRREPRAPDEVGWEPATGRIDSSSLAGVDAVVNLSGATIGRRWTPERKREILESRVFSTSLLARTLAELEPRPSALLCTGGVGIYGDRGDEVLTEESELGAGFLADVGTAWEGAAEAARGAGVRVVNFRQGIVLTAKGGALERMLTPFKLGLGGRIGGGRQWLSWVSLATSSRRTASRWRATSRARQPDIAQPRSERAVREVAGAGRPPSDRLPAARAGREGAVRPDGREATLLEGQRALPARLLDAGFTFSRPELDDALEHAVEER